MKITTISKGDENSRKNWKKERKEEKQVTLSIRIKRILFNRIHLVQLQLLHNWDRSVYVTYNITVRIIDVADVALFNECDIFIMSFKISNKTLTVFILSIFACQHFVVNQSFDKFKTKKLSLYFWIYSFINLCLKYMNRRFNTWLFLLFNMYIYRQEFGNCFVNHRFSFYRL